MPSFPTLQTDSSDIDDMIRDVISMSTEQLMVDESYLSSPVMAGDFVSVKLSSKKSFPHFIGKLMEVPSFNEKGSIIYLKREKPNALQFIFENEDEFDVEAEDIVRKLPKPIDTSGETARVSRHMTFPVPVTVDLSSYSNLCQGNNRYSYYYSPTPVLRLVCTIQQCGNILIFTDVSFLVSFLLISYSKPP